MSNQKDKSNVFRNCIKRHHDVMYRALMVWKENMRYYDHTMDRILIRMINLHKRNLATSFFKWKQYTDKIHMRELDIETENLQNENQDLVNTLNS